MRKIAAADVDDLLIKAASTIRASTERIRELESQLAAVDRHKRAEKIAGLAVDKGIMDEESASEYADDLASSDQDLDVVEQFVGRAANGVPLGEPLRKIAGDLDQDFETGTAEERFASSLLSSEIY